MKALRIEGPGDGERHMALDSAMLDDATEGTCQARIYRWDGPWVSLGRFQRPEQALDLDACARLGVRWVRRPTGGRGVLHGNDVTVSIACPLAELGVREGSVKEAYRALAPVIVEGLRGAGFRAALGEEAPPIGRSPRANDCFLWTSANDVADAASGSKLAGTALRLVRGAVLLQASIPVGPHLVPPEAVYSDGVGAPAPPQLPAAAVVAGLTASLARLGFEPQ
jgi:lipoate-protein ligase A